VVQDSSDHLFTEVIGTPPYTAPEIFNKQPYGNKVDVYSFAMIVWELWTCKMAWEDIHPLDIAPKVMKGNRPEPNKPKQCTEVWVSLIAQVLDITETLSIFINSVYSVGIRNLAKDPTSMQFMHG